MSVGIERLAVYVPATVLPLRALAEARGLPSADLVRETGVEAMAIAPAAEDVATLAANAGARLLRSSGVDPTTIGLLLVASGSSSRTARPASLAVHELLGVGRQCRVCDVRQGAYGATAALMAAADWVRASGVRGRRALVIAADVVRAAPGSRAEAAQGAAGVAMFVEHEPRALLLGEESVPYAASVPDLERRATPDPWTLACYTDALVATFAAYRALERPLLGPDEPFCDRLAHLLYQTPGPALAARAHRRLIELDWQAAPERWARVESRLDEAAAASYRELVAPGVEVLAGVGDAGAAALYVELAAVIEHDGRTLGGRRLGFFAYGDGSAEFFTGVVPGSVGAVAAGGLADLLARRTVLDVAAYERLAHGGDTGGEPPPGFAGDFFLATTRRGRCEYARARLTTPMGPA